MASFWRRIFCSPKCLSLNPKLMLATRRIFAFWFQPKGAKERFIEGGCKFIYTMSSTPRWCSALRYPEWLWLGARKIWLPCCARDYKPGAINSTSSIRRGDFWSSDPACLNARPPWLNYTLQRQRACPKLTDFISSEWRVELQTPPYKFNTIVGIDAISLKGAVDPHKWRLVFHSVKVSVHEWLKDEYWVKQYEI